MQRFLIYAVFALLGVKIAVSLFFGNSYNSNDDSYEDSKAAANYWQARTGTFESTDDFTKVLLKARKQLSQVPKRKTTGLVWEELGPDNIGGRTRAILIDSENPNLMFAGGVSGGLWFSNDAGLTWQMTSPGDFAEVLSVNCITQDDEGYIYYGTGEGVFYSFGNLGAPGIGTNGFRGMGIFRSVEPHGTTFKHLPNSWFGKQPRAVAINAMASDTLGNVYAGGRSALFKSSDRGDTWSEVDFDAQGTNLSGDIYDVKTFDDGGVIMAMGNDYYISPNGEPLTFGKISGPNTTLPTAQNRSVIAIAPSNQNTIYISRAGVDDEFDGLYRSKNGGDSWERIIGGGSSIFTPFTSAAGQGDYNQCLAVYPNNENRLLLGGIDIYRWEEGGNWEQLSDWRKSWADPDYVHADIHTFIFAPNSNNKFYAGTDGGIFKTNNDGAVFQRLNRGFNITQFYGVGFGGDGVVLGGTQDNSNIYFDFNGNTPKSGDVHNAGDGGWSAVSNLNPDAFFVESQFGRIMRDNSRSNSYLEFFSHPTSAIDLGIVGYDGFWSQFVTPFVLWESASDSLVPDTVVFSDSQNYETGDQSTVNSNISGLSFNYTFKNSYAAGDDLKVKVPKQSMLIYGTHQALYITRNAIDFGTNPKWIPLTSQGCRFGTSGYGPSAIATSADGDVIFFGNSVGEIYRIKNVSKVINESTVDSAEVTKIGQVRFTGTNIGGFITDISVDQKNTNHVLVTVGFYQQETNIYQSKTANTTMGDSSFVSVAGNLPQIPIYSALIEYNDGMYLIGTEFGVFASIDSGATWTQETDGPPFAPTTMIRQQTFKWAQNFGQIYTATHGRGVYTAKNYVTSVTDNAINQTISNDEKLVIYPNPVENTLNTNLKPGVNRSFQIFDYSGRLIHATKQNKTSLNLPNFPPGSYVLVVNSTNPQKKYSCSFIREK